jgi:hypothetical protein
MAETFDSLEDFATKWQAPDYLNNYQYLVEWSCPYGYPQARYVTAIDANLAAFRVAVDNGWARDIKDFEVDWTQESTVNAEGTMTLENGAVIKLRVRHA